MSKLTAAEQKLRQGFGHVPALDGMRGAAVMLVITYHFGLLRFGWTGVGLFFMLSGYLITSILLDGENESLGTFLGRFYWRRILRIFPLYFGFVFVVMLLYALTGFPSGAGTQFPYVATFSYNFYMAFQHQALLEQTFHHLWSISNEEQFYLVWPILVYFLGRKGIGFLAIILVFFSPLMRFLEPSLIDGLGLQYESPIKLIYYLPFGRTDAFAVGALLAAMPNGIWRKFPHWIGGMLMVPAIFVIVRSLYRTAIGQVQGLEDHLGFTIGQTTDYFEIWGYSAAAMFFGGTMILVLYGRPNLWIRRIAESQPAAFIGKLSYGMYIIHWPLLLLLEKWLGLSDHLLMRLVQFKLFMMVLIALSWLSYRFYESWFLGKKQLLFPKKT